MAQLTDLHDQIYRTGNFATVHATLLCRRGEIWPFKPTVNACGLSDAFGITECQFFSLAGAAGTGQDSMLTRSAGTDALACLASVT